MQSEDGEYQPLIGHIPLEQCGAAVDPIGHRLIPVGYMDLKTVRAPGPAGARSDAERTPVA